MSRADLPIVFTPATLAEYWSCSEQHVRNMVARGELRALRLGGKLIRIRMADVEEYECRNGELRGSGEGSRSHSSATESATDIRSELMTRSSLRELRQRSSRA
jgi:excisionase family DNA binding protein